MRGVSEDGEDLGELIPTLEKKFQRVGLTLRETDDSFKSTIDIMRGLRSIWDDITDIERADLLEAVAGKTLPPHTAMCGWKVGFYRENSGSRQFRG